MADGDKNTQFSTDPNINNNTSIQKADLQAEIFTLTGNLIILKKINQATVIEINISRFPAGIYILKIQLDNQQNLIKKNNKKLIDKDL